MIPLSAYVVLTTIDKLAKRNWLAVSNVAFVTRIRQLGCAVISITVVFEICLGLAMRY